MAQQYLSESTENVAGENRNSLPTEGVRSSEDRASQEAQSSRGSIAHPYGSQFNDNGFARCHIMATPTGGTETYTRSLFMLGNGMPIWQPVGDLNRPKPSLESGIMIGDVGFLTHEGDFYTYFNIFLPATDALQRRCPPDFVPLHPPLESSDLVTNLKHFPPGSALISKGVKASVNATSPLDVTFKVKARESGILVLPDGASREDLLSATRICDYVQKHALSWYMFLNNSSTMIPFPNGSLYVVTGHDKAVTWAACTSGPREAQKRASMTIRYQDHAWVENGSYMITKRSKASQHTGKCALFIRGIRFAVNIQDWKKHILFDQPPPMIPYYNILSVPVTGIRASIQTLKERLKSYSEKVVICPDKEHIFHPLEIILRILVEESPASSVALTEDYMWCGVADKGDSSLANVIQLVTRVLEAHEISNQDGIVTLVPVLGPEQDQSSSSLSKGLFRLTNTLVIKYQAIRRRKRIMEKIDNVFPGPAIPEHLLEYEA